MLGVGSPQVNNNLGFIEPFGIILKHYSHLICIYEFLFLTFDTSSFYSNLSELGFHLEANLYSFPHLFIYYVLDYHMSFTM